MVCLSAVVLTHELGDLIVRFGISALGRYPSPLNAPSPQTPPASEINEVLTPADPQLPDSNLHMEEFTERYGSSADQASPSNSIR